MQAGRNANDGGDSDVRAPGGHLDRAIDSVSDCWAVASPRRHHPLRGYPVPARRVHRPAFSLIEALVAVAILLIVSGGVFALISSNSFSGILNGDQSTAMSDAQAALRSIAGDLCSASAFATPSHAGGIRVTFASGPAVEYYQDGTALKRLVASTGSPTTTVATGLVSGTGLSPAYYDSSMSLIGGPMDSTKYGQAAAVDVAITITLAHSAFGTVTRTTRVVLRNMIGS